MLVPIIIHGLESHFILELFVFIINIIQTEKSVNWDMDTTIRSDTMCFLGIFYNKINIFKVWSFLIFFINVMLLLQILCLIIWSIAYNAEP